MAEFQTLIIFFLLYISVYSGWLHLVPIQFLLPGEIHFRRGSVDAVSPEEARGLCARGAVSVSEGGAPLAMEGGVGLRLSLGRPHAVEMGQWEMVKMRRCIQC